MKKLITLPRVICFIIVIFVILHITPQMALRTHLVFTGHPKIAFTSNIEEFKKGEETKNVKFYIFKPSPIDRETKNKMLAYKTTRIGFIYLATYHGGG